MRVPGQTPGVRAMRHDPAVSIRPTAPKTVPVRDILGPAEVLELAGVTSRATLQKWRARGFPEPIVTLASGPVWDGREVRAWLARNRRERA